MLSLTVTAVVVSCVLLSLQGNIDPLWVPFGSLALANFIALLLGVTIARQGSTKQDRPSLPRLLERMPSGSWLVRSVPPVAAELVSAWVVIAVAEAQQWDKPKRRG